MLNTWPTNTHRLLRDVSLVTEGPAVLPVDNPRRAWPFDPAWPPSGETVQDTYSFQTEIITSRSGREYRRARRTHPRREIRNGLVLAGEDVRLYKDIMWSWQPRDFVMPDTARRLALPADLPAGTATIYLDDPPGWMLPGLTLVVGEGADREALVIAGVEGNFTHLAAPVSASWPAGAFLYAGLVGNLQPGLETDRVTNAALTGSLDFTVRPLSEAPRVVSAPGTLLDGREVFLRRPNWAEQVSSRMAHEVDVLDYGTGPISRYAPVPFGREVTGATYLGRNVAEVDEMLDFFWRMRGQQGEFWMPTWEPDFVLRGTAPAGSSTLRVVGPRVAELYAGSVTHRGVYALRADGSVALHRTGSITPVDDAQGRDSLISLTAPLDADLDADLVAASGWLLLRRFASDSLTVEWLTDRVANLQLNLTTLEALPGEDPAGQ